MNTRTKSAKPVSALSHNTSPPLVVAPDWLVFAPASFVILWSTGFIGMRLGTPYAEPFSFMALRMAVVVVILLAAAAYFRAPWPQSRAEIAHAAIAGLLIHATYLSGVLYAISLKLPLAFTALIAGLQPLLTGVAASFLLGERLRSIHWLGMSLGLVGVVAAVSPKLSSGEVGTPALLCAAVALLGITAGTIYQKRFCAAMDLRTGGVIQFSATGLVLVACAATFETGVIHWTPQFVFALGWLSLVLSLGAISLLYVMIRHGATAKVASLFFLTPAVTAVMAYLLFDEALSGWAIGGLVISAAGVALVTRK
ncbi:MAG: DMT family transporter [Aeromicrobium sp.]|nr:DMT family transporter [Burkholderiales bacterium]